MPWPVASSHPRSGRSTRSQAQGHRVGRSRRSCGLPYFARNEAERATATNGGGLLTRAQLVPASPGVPHSGAVLLDRPPSRWQRPASSVGGAAAAQGMEVDTLAGGGVRAPAGCPPAARGRSPDANGEEGDQRSSRHPCSHALRSLRRDERYGATACVRERVLCGAPPGHRGGARA
jgi:hypothetical protein